MGIHFHIKHSLAGLVLVVLAAGYADSGAVAAAPLPAARAQEDRATQMLFEAVQTNDFAGAEAAISAGASVDAHDRWNITPIELAIDRGYFRIAHFLVSVRNSRRQADIETAGTERIAGAERKPAATTATAAPDRSAPTKRRQPAQVARPVADDTSEQAVWPADRPNPFDPAVPAFGARLPLVEPSRQAASGTSALPDEGPMLATDTPARNGVGEIR